MTGPVGPGGGTSARDRAATGGAPRGDASPRTAPPDTALPPLPDRALDRVRAQLGTPTLIGGRYELRGLLGRGGMGEVHRAFDRQLGREVAVKVLPPDASAAQLAARLEQESRVLAQLEHPGIVPVYDAGALEDGRVYYVMRYFEGMPLDAYARSGVGRGELLRSLLRIAEAIAYAHERGVIHRDLKPANVMIGPYGDRLVLDWGVAKVLAAEGRSAAEGGEVAAGAGGEGGTTPAALPPEGTLAGASGAGPAARGPLVGTPGVALTADGTVVGTPGYMAPEQAAGGPVDARADVYALGVMLREMLAAHPDPVRAPLAAIVAMATAPLPAARYATVRDLAEDLRRWLDGEAPNAHHEGVLERLWRFVRRHQVAILLLLAYAVVRAVIFLTRGI